MTMDTPETIKFHFSKGGRPDWGWEVREDGALQFSGDLIALTKLMKDVSLHLRYVVRASHLPSLEDQHALSEEDLMSAFDRAEAETVEQVGF